MTNGEWQVGVLAVGIPLLQMIELTGFAVSSDETRYNLNGVFFFMWKSPTSGRSASERRWPSVATARRPPGKARGSSDSGERSGVPRVPE